MLGVLLEHCTAHHTMRAMIVGLAMLIGLAVGLPVLFRLKSRFDGK